MQLFTLPNGEKTIAAGAEVAYPEREFTGPLLPTIDKVAVWACDATQANDGRRSTADDRLRWFDLGARLHAPTRP